MTDFQPELGQWGFSNTPWQQVDSPDWMEGGLEDIADAIAISRGYVEDPEFGGFEQLLISNWGEEEFVSDVFAMRTYCWCDGARDGHQDGCPPNFEHFSTGLILCWYKHAARGRSQNQQIDRACWQAIVTECLVSVRAA